VPIAARILIDEGLQIVNCRRLVNGIKKEADREKGEVDFHRSNEALPASPQIFVSQDAWLEKKRAPSAEELGVVQIGDFFDRGRRKPKA
jgi:hypothetical protein